MSALFIETVRSKCKTMKNNDSFYKRRDISRRLLYNNMYLGETGKCIFIIKMKYESYIKREQHNLAQNILFKLHNNFICM